MFIIVLFAVIASVSANCCPKVKSVDNFQIANYGNGIWYEVARYSGGAPNGSVCGHAEYKLEGDEIKMKNHFVINNKADIIDSVARLSPDAGQSGKLLLKNQYGEHILEIMDIDYDNYFIAYFCNFNEKSHSHVDYAWIFSRSKVLPEDAKAAIDKFVKESDVLQSDKFIWLSFSDDICRVDG